MTKVDQKHIIGSHKYHCYCRIFQLLLLLNVMLRLQIFKCNISMSNYPITLNLFREVQFQSKHNYVWVNVAYTVKLGKYFN